VDKKKRTSIFFKSLQKTKYGQILFFGQLVEFVKLNLQLLKVKKYEFVS